MPRGDEPDFFELIRIPQIDMRRGSVTPEFAVALLTMGYDRERAAALVREADEVFNRVFRKKYERNSYWTYVLRFCLWFSTKNRGLDEVRSGDLYEFAELMEACGYHQSTAFRAAKVLQKFFVEGYGLDVHWRGTNRAGPDLRTRPYTDEEIRNLLRLLGAWPVVKLATVLFLDTGCTVYEVANLRASKIDPRGRVAEVEDAFGRRRRVELLGDLLYGVDSAPMIEEAMREPECGEFLLRLGTPDTSFRPIRLKKKVENCRVAHNIPLEIKALRRTFFFRLAELGVPFEMLHNQGRFGELTLRAFLEMRLEEIARTGRPSWAPTRDR